MTEIEILLEEHGVKPTPNRILIARALATAGRPLSMTELEDELGTIDKSNVFRALTLFRESHLVHALEDSGEGIRYELCHSHDHERDDDLHVHFFCEKCHRTYCLEDIPVPTVAVPSSYEVHGSSFTLRGLCPDCK